MANPRILLSMGTRPEVIKMVPVYLELQKRGLNPLLLHTGQHNEIALSLYQLFGIVPDYHVDLQRPTSTTQKLDDLAQLGSKLLENISTILLEANPDIVMVHGDTSTALMTALPAFYQKRKIAHVEAGLRSFDEHHPFPEEKNRVLIAQLAHWHFAPTVRAEQNLLREGVAQERIFTVGNTIVQAAKLGAERLDALRDSAPHSDSDLISKLKQATDKRVALVTVHRRENQEQGIGAIARAVKALLEQHDDLIAVWPVHPNPKVIAAVRAELDTLSPELTTRLHLVDPLSYPVLLWVLKHSWIVLTDSGGIQEEAVALNTPVLVLRETTERPEVIEVGAGLLIGAGTDKIIATVNALHDDSARYQAMKSAPNPFGDDRVAEHICTTLLNSDGYSHETLRHAAHR